MKKIILALGFAAASVLALPLAALAADPAPSAALPQVSVLAVTLPQTSYAAGDTVAGSFTLKNSSSESVSNVYYMVSLAGSYDGGIPGDYYDRKSFGPVTLAPHEKKDVEFSYVLPAAFHGDNLGIDVEALLNGALSLGWADAFISVSGGSSFATISNPAVIADGTTFAANAGPIVKKAASLSLTIKNPSADAVTLTPHLQLWNRAAVGAPKSESDADAVTLKAGESKTISIPLPTFDFASPGVYVGAVALLDAGKNPVSAMASFRYIVGGDIATLYSVSSDIISGRSGDAANLTVTYSGAPYDITTDDVATIENGALSVTLYNEANAPVGSYNQPFDFNTGSSAAVSVPLTGDAKALRAKVSALSGTKVLSSISAKLSPDYDAIAAAPAAAAPMPFLSEHLLNIAIIVLSLFAAIMITFFARKERQNYQKRKLPQGPMTFIFVLIALGSFAFAHKASAFTITNQVEKIPGCDSVTVDPNLKQSVNRKKNCIVKYSLLPAITMNSPVGTLAADATEFYITGTVQAMACSNSPDKLIYTITYNNETFNSLTKKGGGGGHKLTEHNGHFSYGPFPVPAPGTYRVNVTVENDSLISDFKRVSITSGYQDFTVAGAPTTGSCAAGQYRDAFGNCATGTGSCSGGKVDDGTGACVCVAPLVDDGIGGCTSLATCTETAICEWGACDGGSGLRHAINCTQCGIPVPDLPDTISCAEGDSIHDSDLGFTSKNGTGSCTLNWTVSADPDPKLVCSIKGPNGYSKDNIALSGSVKILNPVSSSVYTLSCSLGNQRWPAVKIARCDGGKPPVFIEH